jgi:large subunit ribosomal protein L6
MAKQEIITNKIPIPQGVSVKLEGLHIIAKGNAGTVDRAYKIKGVSAKLNGNEIEVSGPLREANTLSAHIKNALNGADKGYLQKLKALYAHFPISFEIKGKDIIIKNFLGEKQPRHAKIVGETKVEVKGQEIVVSGPDKEDVGQTIANLRNATRIKNRDSRVFQDGVYPIES